MSVVSYELLQIKITRQKAGNPVPEWYESEQHLEYVITFDKTIKRIKDVVDGDSSFFSEDVFVVRMPSLYDGLQNYLVVHYHFRTLHPLEPVLEKILETMENQKYATFLALYSVEQRMVLTTIKFITFVTQNDLNAIAALHGEETMENHA